MLACFVRVTRKMNIPQERMFYMIFVRCEPLCCVHVLRGAHPRGPNFAPIACDGTNFRPVNQSGQRTMGIEGV